VESCNEVSACVVWSIGSEVGRASLLFDFDMYAILLCTHEWMFYELLAVC